MARYVGVVGALKKYWAASVVDGALVIDEGTLGTLGKRTRVACDAPEKELDKRSKQKLAKGYVRDPDGPPTRDSLLAAFAPPAVEAAHGDPGRARDKALAALASGRGAPAMAAARTALALARRGHAQEARAVLDALDALAPGDESAPRAALLGVCAAAALALGARDAADARLTEAMAMMARHAGAAWSQGHGEEGVEAAGALLDLGRDDDARRVFDASGYVALDAMLARGRLAWFDAALPALVRDGFSRDHFALRRARAAGEEAFAARFLELAAGLPGRRTTEESRSGLVACAAAAREFGSASPARTAAVGLALRDAASRVRAAVPHLLDGHAVWAALGAAADLGADVVAEVAHATTPARQAAAVIYLLPNCRVEAVRAAVSALVPSLLDTGASVDPLSFASALAAWVRQGGRVDAAPVRAVAARAGKGYLALGELAGVALLQGDRDLAWELLGAVRKDDLGTAAGVARRSLLAGGALAGYKTLADTVPPWSEFDTREESLMIARSAQH